MNEAVLSVDIGGSKIAAGLVSRDGSLFKPKTIPTNALEGGEALIKRIIQLCRSYLIESEQSGNPLRAIGISSAGQIDGDSGTVIYATQTLPGWTGMPIKERIEDSLQLPVAVENDVNCLAVGEAAYGAGRGYRHIFCLALGTGIGGAMILNGNLYRGWKGSAGEVGHLSIDENGKTCYCGARGCLECYVSGPAIEKEYARLTGTSSFEGDFTHDSRFNLQQIAKFAGEGDAIAGLVIREAGRHLGQALFGLVNLLNPEIIIIGGGVAALGDLLLDETREVVANLALPSMRDTPVKRAHFHEAQGSLLGAALLSWKLVTT